MSETYYSKVADLLVENGDKEWNRAVEACLKIAGEADAELTRLRAELAERNIRLRAMQLEHDVELAKKDALLKEAREALEYHQEQTRPIDRTIATLARLREKDGLCTCKPGVIVDPDCPKHCIP